jgi:hypothetical protein
MVTSFSDPARVVDDADDAIDRVIDVGVGAVVDAAVDQLHRRAVEQSVHEVREDARVAGFLAG